MTTANRALNCNQTGFLEDYLLRECKAMAKYALDAGMKVPTIPLQELQTLVLKLAKPETSASEAHLYWKASNRVNCLPGGICFTRSSTQSNS